MRILGAIIAGGRSSRMGGKEKLFLAFDGTSILSRIFARTSFQFEKGVINANGDPTRFGKLRVVPDLRTAVHSPLAGIHAVMAVAAAENFDAIVTLPSDTPFLPLDLVERLRGDGAAIAVSGGQAHYLTGFWPTSLAPRLERAFDEGTIRVKDWAKLAQARCVEWPCEPFDPFFNVNTPEDLAEAARIESRFQELP